MLGGGSGFRVDVLRFGFRVKGCRAKEGLGFRVQGFGLGVWGFGCRA